MKQSTIRKLIPLFIPLVVAVFMQDTASAAGVSRFNVSAPKAGCKGVPVSFVFNTMLDAPDPDRGYKIDMFDGVGTRQANPPRQGAFVLPITYSSNGTYTWQAQATDSLRPPEVLDQRVL